MTASGRALYVPKMSTIEVPSETVAGLFYKVQISERGDGQCDCPDWNLNADPRYRCKHIKRVLAERKAVRC